MPVYHLGTDYDAPVRIDATSTSVSHHHADIEVDGERMTLIDNDSTNGTYVEVGGEFRRCKRVEVTPDTWIRLGQEGVRGFAFKARRVLYPDDYRMDFAMIKQQYQQLKSITDSLESKRDKLRYLTPALTVACLGISFAVHDNIIARMLIALPGIITPLMQAAMIGVLEKRRKKLADRLICPKCRRTLTRDDIISCSHSLCKAY